ncbi:unnamed protein product, partial [Rotaria magnacalcarata]
MTAISVETPCDYYSNPSADGNRGEIVTAVFTKERSSLLQRMIDSFKPAETTQNNSIELNATSPGEERDNGVDKDESKLHRALKSRHLQMIAIGGTIGTGLFVGSGGALASGGPAALVLDFAIIGFMLFNVCMALA